MTKEEILQNHCEKNSVYPTSNELHTVYSAMEEYAQSLLSEKWISVEDQPLFTRDDKGNWTCTENGDKEFIAAVPYSDKRQPGKSLWWIHHCVVKDGVGLCVVGEEDNEPAVWELEDVTHYQLFPSPPTK